MTVLFAASELEAFTYTDVPTVTTDANDIDLNHVRSGIQLESLTSEEIATVFTATSDLWFHFNLGTGDFGGADVLFEIYNGSTVLFRIFYASGFPSLQYWDGAAFQTVSASALLTDFTVYTIDVHIKMDATNGEIAWYLNNNQVGSSFTGDTIFTASTNVDNISFRHPDPSGAFLDFIAISEVIVWTESTVGTYLQTTALDGNGATSGFTGDVTDIDENGINDADLISSGTADQVSTFTTTDVSLSATESIIAVIDTARIKNTAGSPQNVQFATRSGGTDFYTANLSGVGVGYDPFVNVQETNPNTSSSWTATNLNSSETGLKSIT